MKRTLCIRFDVKKVGVRFELIKWLELNFAKEKIVIVPGSYYNYIKSNAGI